MSDHRGVPLLLVAVVGCGPAAAPATSPRVEAPDAIVNQVAASSCLVAIDTADGTLAIDGVALPDFEPATLHAALGEPDRVVPIESEQHYEESGPSRGDPWTSTEVEVTDFHHVYDRRGLVFVTEHRALGPAQAPTLLRLFFAHPRRFDNVAAPAVVPADRGGCRLEVNGVAVDPELDARPPGITYRTDRFDAFGAALGTTSIAGVIDGVYTLDGEGSVRLFLDDGATGRPSYAELR